MSRFTSLGACLAAALLLAPCAPAAALDLALMQHAARRLGPQALDAVRALQPLLLRWAGLPVDERLEAVQRFVNERVAFGTDLEVWGQEDYWASPLETLERGRGDCEDYAIAKYALLRATGVAAEQLRLVYAQLRRGASQAPEPHMVLVFQADVESEPLLLDNLQAGVVPVSARPELQPQFSFNHLGLWRRDGQPDGAPLLRLPLWRGVVAKLREQGFD